MVVEYHIRAYDLAGTLKAVIADEFTFTLSNAVNQVGGFHLTLPYDSPYVALRAAKDVFEVWRRVRDVDEAGTVTDAISWYIEGTYLYREAELRDDGAIQTFTAHCTSLEEILAWRVVAYAALTTSKTKWLATPTETIMKDLVKWNLTTSATAANSRYLNAALSYSIAGATLTNQADAAGGTVRDWFCEHRNLLQVLQDLAENGGGDFAVVKTGLAAYEFRFYAGQLGTDRSATVLFSLDRGNMADPVYLDSIVGRPTVAIVGGDGPNDARAIVNVMGADSSNNQVEAFVDARGFTTTTSLTDYGGSQLYRTKAEGRLSFGVLQTPSCLYGRDYVLGDKVSGRAFGVTTTYKVAGRTVTFTPDGDEQLTIGLNNA